jgi:predicted dehydrogenase
MRLGLIGTDSSHAELFLDSFNVANRHSGQRIVALWGQDEERTRILARRGGDIAVVAQPHELLGAIDGAIIGDRHGDLHRGHAAPFLEAGLPVFVDKPLANSPGDAEALVALARRSGAALCSASALRWQRDMEDLKRRLASLGALREVEAYGTWYPQSEYGGPIFYGIHSVEMAQELVGPDWDALTVTPGREPNAVFRAGDVRVRLDFRPLADSGESEFGVRVRAEGGEVAMPIRLPDDYMEPVIDRIAEMMRTCRAPLSDRALVSPVALMQEIAMRLEG